MSAPEWANSSGGPPPPNPILSAYEGFVKETPLVTRYVLTTLFATWFLSFFMDPTFALSNVPFYTLFRFEIYRIFLSPFICYNFLSLVFAYLSFNTSGKRLEFSMGSTAFGWLLFTIGTVTNVAFIILCTALYALTNEEGWLHRSSNGIWTILFGVITIECVAASQASLQQYNIFSVAIPTQYYPLVLFAIFSLLGGGFSFGDLMSVSIGYAYAYGYLDRLKLSNARFKEWEDNYMGSLTRREGWVVGHAATGGGAWTNISTAGGTVGLFQPSSSLAPVGQEGVRNASNAASIRDVSFGGTTAAEAATTTTAFPASGGRPLGATQRRSGSADTRAARLEALEKRTVVDTEVEDNDEV